jgi:hypothetical protein
VLRIRRSEDAKGSKSAGETLKLIASDDSGAGNHFEPSELNTRQAYKDDLVVVVGEVLPADTPGLSTKDVKKLKTPVSGRKPTSAKDFKRQVHHIVPTQKRTHILVRKLLGDRVNLFILIDKQNGLYGISQLPSNFPDTRLVFYPEWTDGPQVTTHRDRATQWKKNTTDFCEKYIATHGFLDVNKASDRPKTVAAPREDPATNRKEDILKGLAAYQDTNDRTHLDQVLSFINRAIGERRQYAGRPSVDLLFTKPDDIDADTASIIAEELCVS